MSIMAALFLSSPAWFFCWPASMSQSGSGACYGTRARDGHSLGARSQAHPLLRQMVTESVTLALMGGVTGVMLGVCAAPRSVT